MRSETTSTDRTILERATIIARLDLDPEHRQPAAWRVLLGTVVAVVASVAADAAVVAVAELIFPGTKGYSHFQFADYTKLTVIGVIIASAAWPVTTRVSSAPQWLFYRLAILVTLVLFLPDVYLLYRGQPTDAVVVLMVMHIAIALVAYNVLVRGAPIRPAPTSLADPAAC